MPYPVAAVRGHIYKPASVASNGLLNSLVSYWGLDEAAGANNALDKHSGARTLTQNASPGSAAGKVYSGARTFNGSTQYFSRASETSLQAGDNDLTWAAWVYLTSNTTNQFIISKWNSQTEYLLYYNYNDWEGPYWTMIIRHATDVLPVRANTAGAASTGTWYLVMCWHDATANQIGISVNNGTADTVAHTTGLVTSTEAFCIGGGASGYYSTARIGPVMMWKSTAGNGGILSAAKKTALYNAGAGLAYASFTT
jgi:hypothetical protein